MSLEKFLTAKFEGGKKVPALMKHFKVSEAALYHWRRGYALPRPNQMVQIVAMSKGQVSYKEMIETFVATRLKSTKKKKVKYAPNRF